MQQKHVEAYLERIGWSGSLARSAETLAGLHEAHMLTVPFENLDIHAGREIVLDLGRLYDKIVVRRRGGFCYELNGMFAELLRSVGFELDLLSARVADAQGIFGPEFDHMASLVRQDGRRWLADVGFGDSFRRPLDLDDPVPQRAGDPQGRAWHVRPNGAELELVQTEAEGSARVTYTFTLEPRQLSDYAAMCVYQQTSPESSFTQRRICSRATADGRISLANDRLIVTSRSERTELAVPEEKRSEVLAREFGVVL